MEPMVICEKGGAPLVVFEGEDEGAGFKVIKTEINQIVYRHIDLIDGNIIPIESSLITMR